MENTPEATLPLCTCQLSGSMHLLYSLNKSGWVFSYLQLKAAQLVSGHLVLGH